MKRCTKCGELKDTTEFYKDGKGGLHSWCKSCKNAKLGEWYERNPDKYQEHNRKWGAEHPEKKLEYNRSLHAAKPFLRRLNDAIRRAREKGGGGKITTHEWEALIEKYGYKCLCCGRSDAELTLDHVKPLVLGGENVIGNAQPLCKSCNSKKGKKHIDYRPF